MTEQTINIVLQSLLTVSGLISTLILTIFIFFLGIVDKVYNKISEYEHKSYNAKPIDKLPLSFQRAIKVNELKSLKSYVTNILLILAIFSFVFLSSLCNLTIVDYISIDTKHIIIFILVFATIGGFFLILNLIYELLLYYDMIGSEDRVLKDLFYKGAIWRILYKNGSDEFEILNTRTNKKIKFSKKDALPDAIFNNPSEFF